MLHIVLVILKIIGIILLALVALALILVALVLSVPIRYKVHGAKEEMIEGQAVVSWLLHLLHVQVDVQADLAAVQEKIKYHMVIKIFGFTFYDNLRPPKPEKTSNAEFVLETQDVEDKTEVRTELLKEPQGIETDKEPSEMPETVTETVTEPAEKAIEEDTKTTKPLDHESEPKSVKEQAKGIQSQPVIEGPTQKTGKLEGFADKVHGAWDKGIAKGTQLRDKKDSIMAIFEDAGSQAAIGKIKRSLIGILNHIRPRKLYGHIHFGFSDPAATGQTLGYASMLYPVLTKVNLVPDFEKEVLEGELTARGRIRLGYLVTVAVGILLDKNIKKMFRQFKKI